MPTSQRGYGPITGFPPGGPMPYAVVLDGRDDVAAVLMLLDDRAEAEVIAVEVRAAGHRVEVRQVSEGRSNRWRATTAAPAPN